MRQFPNKSNGIGKQERQIVNHHFSYGRIERCKQFIFGKNIAFAQQIHDGAFPNIGISNKGNTHQLTSITSLHFHLFVNCFQLNFQKGNFLLYDSSIRFNFRFPWTSHSDTSFLSIEVSPHIRETRQ